MSSSTRSDQSLSQGQSSDPGGDAALQQVITERNSLRSQNDQLWKIIEKQRIIIQNLQKDVAKMSTERDLLRRLAAENDGFRNNSLNSNSSASSTNGHHQQQHSKRSLEKKSLELDSTPVSTEQSTTSNDEKEKDMRLASASSSSLSESIQESLPESRQEAHTSGVAPHPTPLTPSSNYDDDFNNDEAMDIQMDGGRPSISREESASLDNMDSEIQVATSGNRIQLQSGPIPTSIAVDRDVRSIPPRSESAQSVGSPTNSRNISGSIVLGAIGIGGAQLPLPPPRSPRRERRDVGDNPSSPSTSDNEDESYQPSLLSKRKGVNVGKYTVDQPSPLSQQSLQSSSETQDQDTHIMSASKISLRSPGLYESSPIPTPTAADFEAAIAIQTAAVGRKAISAQIPHIPASAIAAAAAAAQNDSQEMLASPGGTLNPAPPIAAIIDQDAEKFRNYMSKFSSPRHSGRRALTPVNGTSRNNVTQEIIIPETNGDNIDMSRPSREHNDNGFYSDTFEADGTQSSIPSDNRIKKRDSNLQLFEDYPKIAARTTSHQRDDDDNTSGHGMPLLPKRYESHTQPDAINISRVASPTPSGNSSVTAMTPTGYSSMRSLPSLQQQAFTMFSESLEFVSALVVGSNISTNDRGKELLTFTISIGQETAGEQDDVTMPHREEEELWRVEKQYVDFLRITQSRNIVNSLPKLPDKSLFTTHAPSKVDARKVALEQYLQHITTLRIKDTRDLLEFLSTNVVERDRRKDERGLGWKEGYLTKRGKNFGGWKTRYFILRGPILEYFDSKDGHHLGSIVLLNAQIGRQQTPDRPQDPTADASDPNSYRHAFLILEPKKGQSVVDAKKNPGNVIRHVLCAETDQERDGWVEALMLYVGRDSTEPPEPTGEQREKSNSGRRMPEIQKLGATPIKDLQSSKGNEKLLLNQDAYERQQRSIPTSQSTPQLNSQGAGIVIGRGGSLPQSPTGPEERSSGERPSAEGPYPLNSRNNSSQQTPQVLPRNPSSQSLPQEETYKLLPDNQSAVPFLTANDAAEKKSKTSRITTFWGKKNPKDESTALVPGQPGSQQGSTNAPAQDTSRLRNFLGKGNNNTNGSASAPNLPGQVPLQGAGSQNLAPAKQVFGVTLEQAIEQAQIQVGYELPAVVYRCIEYLNAHNAKMEEGIYRLNGSAAVIKGLKERFNQEGDVTLLQEEDYYDIHAVAGLLKLFLRELPSSVLTRESHKDFLQVIELPNRIDRVEELTRLVATLPEANYTILRALTAHLIEIVDNADVNKMTARNVGIVFSPTLGIPAAVFSLLMSDFDQIFHTEDGRIMPLENSDGTQHGHQNQQNDTAPPPAAAA
ncbi:hypothetical protein BGZ76_000437, partial [Entomortierella beljakovae]